jgi:FKBP-type peptidyl-prolyl cis-trans isomerase FklB
VDAEERQRVAEQRYATDPSFRKLADDNLAKSKALLDQNAAMAGVEVLPDGVQIQELKPGDGRVIDNAKFVTANFEVDLADGTLVRASDPGKPMRVSTGEALPALLDATRGMRVGAKWRVILPPEKAYGLAGKPPVIGPNQALRYEIELINAE